MTSSSLQRGRVERQPPRPVGIVVLGRAVCIRPLQGNRPPPVGLRAWCGAATASAGDEHTCATVAHPDIRGFRRVRSGRAQHRVGSRRELSRSDSVHFRTQGEPRVLPIRGCGPPLRSRPCHQITPELVSCRRHRAADQATAAPVARAVLRSAASRSSSQAIAHRNPANSRATATTACWDGLPRLISRQ